MPETKFEIWINGETKILVERFTERGRMVIFSIVLMVLTDNGWAGIGRFDTAHGCPHQDILGKKGGLLAKIWLDEMTPRNAFHYAIKTFKTNHELIRKNYFAN